MKIPAYCSYEFLEQLALISPKDISDIEKNKKYLQWIDLIKKCFNVFTDASAENILSLHTNPYIKYLIKKNRITPLSSKINEIKNNPQTFFSENKEIAIYFLNIESKEYERKYGYSFLSPSLTPKTLTSDYFKMFEKGVDYSWDIITNIFNPHHSLIIADPYVFSRNNFDSYKSLLLKIAPKNLETSYHLTIIGNDNTYSATLPDAISISTMMGDLSSTLKSLIPKTCVEYHIFNSREEFHDRFAITNQIHINSGRGLSIFRDSAKVAKATHSTYWSGKKPCTLIEAEDNSQIEFYEVLLNNLKLIKSWIARSSNITTSNPLFK